MKSTKKLVSLLLVAVMAIGMTMTVFATNNSMTIPEMTQEQKVSFMTYYVYANAKVAAGQGTIATITDKDILASAYDQTEVVDDYVYKTMRSLLKDSSKYAYTYSYTLIDMQGITSGEVTVQLQDQGGYKLDEMKGRLAVVCHMNTTTGKWEQMKDLALVDDNGCVTFSFNSYSPILITVTNVKPADLKADSGITIKEATMTPQQVVAGDTTKSPKMGE